MFVKNKITYSFSKCVLLFLNNMVSQKLVVENRFLNVGRRFYCFKQPFNFNLPLHTVLYNYMANCAGQPSLSNNISLNWNIDSRTLTFKRHLYKLGSFSFLFKMEWWFTNSPLAESCIVWLKIYIRLDDV